MAFEIPRRLQTLPPYLFVDIDRKKRAAREAGKDVIDFGIGDPDTPTPDFIIERMNRAMRIPANHRYPRGDGSNEFRAAMAEFFRRRYGVGLDPDREIAAVIGTKEGIGHLPLAVLNPGDVALIPDPAYPVYFAGTVFAGGTPYILPLREDHDWLPNLGEVPPDIRNRAKLLFINYPNNPTGAIAPRGFFEQVVRFAQQHGWIVASDAAYNEMYFDQPVPSIFEIAGAREVAVEFHSLSKTFNMTGWRLGFVAGSADVVAALNRIKANLDSGPFTAIQEAGIEAYSGIDRPEIVALRSMYRERAALLADGLAQFGFRVRPLHATFYLWVGVPRGYTSMSLATRLLDEAAVVCIPGTGFGSNGEGYVRFALTVDTDRIRAALDRLRKLDW